MDDDDFITVGAAFPQIVAVAPLAGLVVLVTWAGGKQVAVDLGPTLHRFKVYAPLRADRALFETVHVANGSTIAWGADDTIDMHVGEIERLAGEAMEAADFKAWMASLGLTLDSAAALLGMSRRMVAYYAGGREIPRYVALACAQLATIHGSVIARPRPRPPTLSDLLGRLGSTGGDKAPQEGHSAEEALQRLEEALSLRSSKSERLLRDLVTAADQYASSYDEPQLPNLRALQRSADSNRE